MPKAEFDRRTILAGIAAIPFSGCALHAASLATSIGIATFNIWHDAGGNWPARLALLTAALRAADADVIALQEVLEDAGKGLPNQASTIANALGYPEVHFVAVESEGAPKRYGNAILTRWPVIEIARRRLEPLSDFRTAIRLRVQIGSEPVDIVATHLAWQPEAAAVRTQQATDLLDWLPDDAVPRIIMGDFNAPLDDPGLRAFGLPRFASALPRGATATTLNPERGHKPRVIDHIFVERSKFVVTDAHIIGDTPVNGEYPSDHFGVVARVARLR